MARSCARRLVSRLIRNKSNPITIAKENTYQNIRGMLKKVKNKKVFRRQSIRQRIRRSITGTPERPRLSVFRSNKDIYVQLIDDTEGRTLASASSRMTELSGQTGTKTEMAVQVGKAIAAKANALGIDTVVFDRGGYLYHGRVKSLAEAAREAGLKF